MGIGRVLAATWRLDPQREPRVALSIADPENPYRYLGIQGRVVDMTETGGDAHIDKMAKKYLGQDRYPFRKPGEERVIVRITPIQKLGMS